MFKKKEKVVTPPPIEIMSRGEWMQKYWRPCAAFMYMICCLADFAIFPIMFTVVQFWETQAANDAFRQWVPITLQGGGLFHVSMCAVLGVSAYGRTQEKLAGQSAVPPTTGGPDGLSLPSTASTTHTPVSGSQPFNAGGFGGAASPAGGSFGSAPSGNSGFGGGSFGSAPVQTTVTQTFSGGFGGAQPVATTAGGKKIVPDTEQPLL